MKKLALLLCLFSSTVFALPSKWVEIARSGGDIVYGNTQDEYGGGTAWIAVNMASGRSAMIKIGASCYGQKRFYIEHHSILYAKKDFKGGVLQMYDYTYSNKPVTNVFPDTVSENIFKFACHIS